MNTELMFSSKSNEWKTPSRLYYDLDHEFEFVLDAAATKENALCDHYFTEQDNALVQDWSKYKTVWLNPPYSRIQAKFIKKAYEESQKGCTVVMLIPARTDTVAFFKYCIKGEIRFIKGRIKFDNGQPKLTPAPFPSMIVIFRKKNIPCVKFIEQTWNMN